MLLGDGGAPIGFCSVRSRRRSPAPCIVTVVEDFRGLEDVLTVVAVQAKRRRHAHPVSLLGTGEGLIAAAWRYEQSTRM